MKVKMTVKYENVKQKRNTHDKHSLLDQEMISVLMNTIKILVQFCWIMQQLDQIQFHICLGGIIVITDSQS